MHNDLDSYPRPKYVSPLDLTIKGNRLIGPDGTQLPGRVYPKEVLQPDHARGSYHTWCSKPLAEWIGENVHPYSRGRRLHTRVSYLCQQQTRTHALEAHIASLPGRLRSRPNKRGKGAKS